MKYVEQSYKDLRLYLLEEEIQKGRFHLISESKFSNNNCEIEFGILAESHFVTVKKPEYIFSEICACIDINIPNAKKFLLTDTRKAIRNKEFAYSFTHKVTNFSVGTVRLAALRSKRAHPYCYYLEHVFPTALPGEISPVTEVYITMGDQVLIESVHTYPNKDAMVFTISTLEEPLKSITTV